MVICTGSDDMPATLDPTQRLLDLRGARVASLHAANSRGFLRSAFRFWQEGRLFAITRTPGALEGLGLRVESVTADGPPDGGWETLEHQPRRDDTPAQITFSSGTEGRPKAILLSHRNLADVVERLNAAMQVTDEIREYIGVPVTYSFGLGRARAVSAAGGSFFLPEQFDPVQIRDMLQRGEINAISAVPSLWRVVLGAPELIGAAGRGVRWIEIGSQAMAAADKAAMRDLFPNARIIQHYGLTEASRSTFLDISRADDAALESVGSPVGSTEIRITPEGAIAIRGDHVALGRITEGGAVQPLTDDEGWLVTRDEGEWRDGRLYYLGRLDDQMNLAGIKIGAEGLEADIRRLVPAAGEHFAVAPVADADRGEAALLAIEADAADTAPLIEAAARLALSRRGVAAGAQGSAGALKVVQLDRLPRTGTNKVQRRQLARDWSDSAQAVPAAPLSSPDLSEDEARLAAVWARVIGTMPPSAERSFYDAGGDSLSSVRIGLVMESEGLPRPVIRATMEGRSLREAAALMAETGVGGTKRASAQANTLSDAARRSWAITMTRALMALSVLVSHWGPGLFARLGMDRAAETVLALIYRMGTPGFAAVFGFGIGFFMLPGFADKRGSVLPRLAYSFRLVLLGMVMLAAIKLANVVAEGRPVNGLAIAHGFYSVLGYYALMLGTARWWLPAVARLNRPIPWLLAGLPALWLAWQVVPAFLPSDQLESVLEWPRLMLLAGYNVFKMTAVAAAGMAAGLWLANERDTDTAGRVLAVGGALGIVLTVASLLEAHGGDAFIRRDSPVFTSLPGLILYLSTAVFGVGVFLAVLGRWTRLSAPIRWPLQLLVVIGGMALPIYVFHGLVLPTRSLLETLGLHGAISLALPMAAFLAVMGYLGRRLWRMYFG